MTSKTTDEDNQDNDQIGVKDDHFKMADAPLPPDIGENSGTDEYFSGEANAFDVFDRLWAATDPRRAPRLLTEPVKQEANDEPESIPVKTKRSVQSPRMLNIRANVVSTANFIPPDAAGPPRVSPVREVERLDAFNRRAAVPLEILPFHHLISFAPLASVLTQTTVPPTEQIAPAAVGGSEARRQLCWQAFAAHGIPARDAVLFDDALRCRLNEYAEDGITEID